MANGDGLTAIRCGIAATDPNLIGGPSPPVFCEIRDARIRCQIQATRRIVVDEADVEAVCLGISRNGLPLDPGLAVTDWKRRLIGTAKR